MLRQSVNLLSDDLVERRPPFDSRWIVAGVLLCVLLQAAISGYQRWSISTQSAELRQLQAARTSALTELEQLNAQFPPPQPSRALIGELAEARLELRGKQQVMAQLESSSFGNETGFSGHLLALARGRVEGVWLTAVELRKGGEDVAVSGLSLETQLVPDYLRQLSTEAAFSGRTFDYLRIARDDPNARPLAFQMRTVH